MVESIDQKINVVIQEQGAKKTAANLKKLTLPVDDLAASTKQFSNQLIFQNRKLAETVARGKALRQQFALPFRAELLSLLFGFMALNRAATTFLRNAIVSFNKAFEGTSNLQKITNKLSAAWEFFKFRLIDALTRSDLFKMFIDNLSAIIDTLSDLTDEQLQAIAITIALTAIISGVGFVLASAGLFVTGIKQLGIFASVTAGGTAVGGLIPIATVGLAIAGILEMRIGLGQFVAGFNDGDFWMAVEGALKFVLGSALVGGLIVGETVVATIAIEAILLLTIFKLGAKFAPGIIQKFLDETAIGKALTGIGGQIALAKDFIFGTEADKRALFDSQKELEDKLKETGFIFDGFGEKIDSVAESTGILAEEISVDGLTSSVTDVNEQIGISNILVPALDKNQQNLTTTILAEAEATRLLASEIERLNAARRAAGNLTGGIGSSTSNNEEIIRNTSVTGV